MRYILFGSKIWLPKYNPIKIYSNSSWKDVDGWCHETLERKICEFENSSKSLDRLDFRRMESLSQGTMITKEKLNVDKYGMRIIGTADDTFN